MSLKDVKKIKLSMFKDNRGTFERIFCQNKLKLIKKNFLIKQVSLSKTFKRGTIRGLHMQRYPFTEIKYIFCIKGKIYDVAVDIRHRSKTRYKFVSNVLDAKDNNALFIPSGFAHGFQALTNNCEVIYLISNFYNAKSDKNYNAFDPLFNIPWPIKKNVIISKKDKKTKFIKAS
jgi:dTDP-4-dehydrorhamnose 3,5-epimerase